MKKLSVLLLVTFFGVGMASQAFCADLAGRVFDQQGHATRGIQISVELPSGKAVAQAVTDVKGKYRLENLAPGTYHLVLNPGASGFKGQTVVAYLGPKGLTVDWAVSPTAPALALATPGVDQQLADADPFGMSQNTFGYLLGGLLFGVGGGLSGAASAGAFSGPSHHPAPPISPSM
jgi:Carboxypeptidase regulatory-like domain